jgi:hypothetical protein
VNNSFFVTVGGDDDLAVELKELSKVRKVRSHEPIVKEASTVHTEKAKILQNLDPVFINEEGRLETSLSPEGMKNDFEHKATLLKLSF